MKAIKHLIIIILMKDVACGIMYDTKNKILMGQRKDIQVWEFPGGKQEEGENILDCLRREWMEELNLEIEIDKEIHSHEQDGFRCRFFIGRIKYELDLVPRVHQRIQFIDVFNLNTLDLFPADYAIQPILEKMSCCSFSSEK
jgi:8-oxo-dGTP diphosphatase